MKEKVGISSLGYFSFNKFSCSTPLFIISLSYSSFSFKLSLQSPSKQKYKFLDLFAKKYTSNFLNICSIFSLSFIIVGITTIVAFSFGIPL